MFDSRKFMAAKFESRTEWVDTPALSDFFEADEKPGFKVRGLTASELAKSIDAATKQKNIDTVIQAISSNEAKITELREAIGISNDTPVDIVKRLEQLVMGSVSPVIDFTTAVKLAEVFPVEFYMITNTIVNLTGLGMNLKKPATSGAEAA